MLRSRFWSWLTTAKYSPLVVFVAAVIAAALSDWIR